MVIYTDRAMFLVRLKQILHYKHNAQITMVATFGKELR